MIFIHVNFKIFNKIRLENGLRYKNKGDGEDLES